MANTDRKAVGLRIKKIRVIDLKLKQSEFAAKLGTTQSSISRFEKGEALPPADMLLKIAKLGNTTVEEILEGG